MDGARQSADERSEGAIPVRRLRAVETHKSEHLVLLSFNTSYIMETHPDVYTKLSHRGCSFVDR